jgi:hypothetical protein
MWWDTKGLYNWLLTYVQAPVVGAIPIRVSNIGGYLKYRKWFLVGATDDTEQIPFWEAKRFSASHGLTCVLCMEGHQFLSSTKQSTPRPLLSTSILIFPSTPKSSKWSPYSDFLIKSLHRFLSYKCATCPAHPIILIWSPMRVWWRVQTMKLLCVQLSPFSRYFFHFRPKYSPQHLVIQHTQSVFFSLHRITSFTPT